MNENNTFYCSFVSIHYIICECGETVPSEDALKDHIEKDPSHTNKLSQVKLEYAEEEILQEFKCGECFKIFDTEEECIEHQEITHVSPVVKEEIVKTEDSYSSIPQEVSNKPLTNAIPFTVTSKPFRVTSQPVNSQRLKLIGQTVKRATAVVNQDGIIYKPFNLENISAKSPVIETNDPVVFSGEPVTITTQPMTFNVRRRMVKLNDGREKKPKIQKIKKVVCEVCGKNYASNAALSYHQRVHTGVRPYQCTYCPKNFTMPLFLQIHLRIHTGEKPYQCPHCPKAFTNKAALLRHDRVHTGSKPYECPQCGKSFSQSNSMKLHVLTVHMKMPAPYKSKKRRAESLARKERDRNMSMVNLRTVLDEAQIVKTEIKEDEFHEVYEEVYQNSNEEVYPKNEEVHPNSNGEVYQANPEVYYYDIPLKEEIAYEIIYET